MDMQIPIKLSYAEVRYERRPTIDSPNILLAQSTFSQEPNSNWRADFTNYQDPGDPTTMDLDTRPKAKNKSSTPVEVRSVVKMQMFTYVRNHGQIGSLTLSGDWAEDPPHHGPGTSLTRLFKLKDNPNVTVGLFYRGTRISSHAAQAFHNLLTKESHMLYPNELASLTEVLKFTTPTNNKGFDLLLFSTQLINGKMVLVTEGKSLTSPSMSTFAIYVDSDNTGQAVQEIYFRCPTSMYAQYVKGKDHPFKEIRWK